MWDVRTGKKAADLKGHKGHITALATNPSEDDILFSGAQDGQVRLWDRRQGINTMNLGIHTGAINEILCGENLLFTVGADQRLICMDMRQNFTPLWEKPTTDFVYSMILAGDVVITGDGQGNVVCRDFAGNQKYALKAGANAIRCLAATATCLVCGGDDGNAIFYDF